MAFVGDPFEHDIFISYSHSDPGGTGVSKLRQWSQGFAAELESELRAYPQLSSELKVFLDQHHRPDQGLDPLSRLSDQLQAEIQSAALLTVLMSPHYLASKWCAAERDWWYQSQKELELPIDGRIAVVRIWPTKDAWPATLSDSRGEELVGFCFYDKEQADLRPQPFDWPEPGPTSRDPFRRAVTELAGRLVLRLEDVKKLVVERSRRLEEAKRLAANSGQVVYLHGRSEHAQAWDRAAEALSCSGLVVLPGEPDPVVSDARRLQEIRQLRVETMSGCDALLLVATDDTRAVDADLVVVGRQDRNSARAISNRLLPCALIDQVGAVLATPKRKVAARSLNVEWIDATLLPWPPAVQAWLTRVAQAEVGS